MLGFILWNGRLRQPFLTAGEDLVTMSPEDMASNARKSENAQIRKEALKESERGQHLKKVCLLD